MRDSRKATRSFAQRGGSRLQAYLKPQWFCFPIQHPPASSGVGQGHLRFSRTKWIRRCTQVAQPYFAKRFEKESGPESQMQKCLRSVPRLGDRLESRDVKSPRDQKKVNSGHSLETVGIPLFTCIGAREKARGDPGGATPCRRPRAGRESGAGSAPRTAPGGPCPALPCPGRPGHPQPRPPAGALSRSSAP